VQANYDWKWRGGVALGLGTQVFFLATVWKLFWFLRDGSGAATVGWLWIDVCLALQFVVPHSLLLLPRVKSRVCKVVPAEFYGSLFCAVTCVGLWFIFLFWQGSNSVVWQAAGIPAASVRLAFYGSWIALFLSLRLSGFGYQTGWTQWLYWMRRQPLPRRGLVDRGPYRLLRHPVYLSFLGLIWFTPRMTLDHALLTGVWTIYIFVGSCLKDQRLAFYLGDEYRRYASRVAGYPLMFFGPLARWRRPIDVSQPEMQTLPSPSVTRHAA
jgi:methanethiol S-methyltransferase